MQANSLLSDSALAAWRSAHASENPCSPCFVAHSEPCFLVLLDMRLGLKETGDLDESHDQLAHDWAQIAQDAQACLSVKGLENQSLWECCARASLVSDCHIFLNLDLLTIDANAQDWGDFKIKPEQVEVQRSELTQAALLKPRSGFVFQVLKSSAPAFNELLRHAALAQYSATIGKTWGRCEPGAAVLDVYRDAKKQICVSASELSALLKPKV